MLKLLITLFSVSLLSACASTLPSVPGVLVFPVTGKDFNNFHNDDLTCRQSAHAQLEALPEQPDSKEEGQQNFDISYIQCMYVKGHRVPVPGELMFNTQQEWHAPPPPEMPAPPKTISPPPAAKPPQ